MNGRDARIRALRSGRAQAAIAILFLLGSAASGRAADGGAKGRLRSGIDRYRAFDYTGAVDDLRASLDASTAAGDEKTAALALRALGDAFLVLGRDGDAEGAYRRLLEFEQRHHAPADPALNATRWVLYAVETSLGRHEEAGKFFREVVEESPRAIVTTLVLVDASDINKVTLLSGFPVKYSEPLSRRALRIHERVYGADRAAAPMARLAAVLRELHRNEEAQRLEARVRGLGAGSPAGQ